MTSLESYLRGPNKEDGAFMRRLLSVIDEVVPLFYRKSFDLKLGESPANSYLTWPYAVSGENSFDSQGELKNFSASTHCMILFALDALGPRKSSDQFSVLLGQAYRPCKLSGKYVDPKKLKQVIIGAKAALVTMFKNKELPQPIVRSGTYGNNDPFTLTWLADLVFRFQANDLGVRDEELVQTKEALCQAVGEALRRKSVIESSNRVGTLREVPGSFLKVRRLQLAITAEKYDKESLTHAGQWIAENTMQLWDFFDNTIHRQLSYSAMGEPKFDPAELVFAFEGALLLHPSWIGRSTVDKVFEALKLSKDGHSYWRPTTPFLANERGEVLFLVSVEVANSILRSCEILDTDKMQPASFSHFEPQLRAYATWLFGEMEEFYDAQVGKPNLVGWRTDYDVKRNTIQLWHTSHILVFLAHYASLLKQKIAADGVEAAGLFARTPDQITDYWGGEPLPSLASEVGNRYAVLKRIQENFILPRQKPDEHRSSKSTSLYSMLLYGPPGTGKTTVAEQLAAILGRPLIIVTVSDFLAAGATEIENRAKDVFEVLKAQENVIILFDEIDQFLLDRNSDRYQEQDDVFKFMTPGMLTKLQDLRDVENSIFIVATNYYERIDSAIKRRGRIDEHFLLCLPDQQRRLEILHQFAPKFDEPSTQELRKASFNQAVTKQEVLKNTVLLGWGDLKNLVKSKTKYELGMSIADFAIALAKASTTADSAVSLSAYGSRFDKGGEPPIEEFFLLLYLMAESEKPLAASEKQTILQILRNIPGFQGEVISLWKDKHIKELHVAETVQEYLSAGGILIEWEKTDPNKTRG